MYVYNCGSYYRVPMGKFARRCGATTTARVARTFTFCARAIYVTHIRLRTCRCACSCTVIGGELGVFAYGICWDLFFFFFFVGERMILVTKSVGISVYGYKCVVLYAGKGEWIANRTK